MVVKKFIKRGNKTFGPYYYESVRQGSKVRKDYIGGEKEYKDWKKKHQHKSGLKNSLKRSYYTPISRIYNQKLLLISLGIFIILLIGFFAYGAIKNNNFTGLVITDSMNESQKQAILYENEIVNQGFNSSSSSLEIKEPPKVSGEIINKNKNKRMDFETTTGKIRLYFDLLNYSEFVDNVASEIDVTQNNSVISNNETSSENFTINQSIENETSLTNITNPENVTINMTENMTENPVINETANLTVPVLNESNATLNNSIENETIPIINNSSNESTGVNESDSGVGNGEEANNSNIEQEPQTSEPVAGETTGQGTTNTETSSETNPPADTSITGNLIRLFSGSLSLINNFFGISGRIIQENLTNETNNSDFINENSGVSETNDIGEIGIDDVKEKLGELENSKINEIADNSIALADNFDVKVSSVPDKTKENKNSKNSNDKNDKYKWGYKVKLSDLNFMAKIDVTTNQTITIYNNDTLKIGRNLISFKDLVDAGYKVRFVAPALEIPIEISIPNDNAGNVNPVNIGNVNNEEGVSQGEQQEQQPQQLDEINNTPAADNNTDENPVVQTAGITGNVIENFISRLTGKAIQEQSPVEDIEYKNTISVYIEKDFNNSDYKVGDIIELDPTLVIIPAIDAEHLDSNKTLIENVYDYVKQLDNNWTDIPAMDYLRVAFSKPLTKRNDITIFAKSDDYSCENNIALKCSDVLNKTSNETVNVCRNTSVENCSGDKADIGVFRQDSDSEIARFNDIGKAGYYKIYLSNLSLNESLDTFDLKVLNNTVSFDYVIDPSGASSEGSDTEWYMPYRWLNHTAWDGNNYGVITGFNNANYTTTAAISGSPAVVDGSVYIVSEDGHVYQFNASNVSQMIKEGFTFSSCPIQYTSPAVISNNYLYFGDTCGYLYQYDVNNIDNGPADYYWNGGTGSFWDTPIIANGYLYSHDSSNTLYQFDIMNPISWGPVHTNYQSSGFSSLTYSNGYLYTMSGSTLLQYYGSDIDNGGIGPFAIYDTNLNGGCASYSAIAVYGGYIYTTDTCGNIFMFDDSDITLGPYESTSVGNGINNAVTIANSYLYVGDSAGYLYQFDPNLIMMGYQYIAYTGTGVYSQASAADGYVYAGDNSGILYQFDWNNVNSPISNYTTGASISSNPAVANGYVYFGSADGNMYQLNATNISLGNPPSGPSLSMYSPTNGANYNKTNPLFDVSSSVAGTGTIIPKLDGSLISWWRMDDLNSSGGVVDYMGRNNGTNFSVVQNNSGKFGKAMSFNGSGNYIQIPALSMISTGKPFTLSSWVYPLATSGSYGGYRTIIGYDGLHRLLIVSGGQMLSQQDGNLFSAGSGDVPDGQWTQVIYWYNGTTERWYINGVKSGSDNPTTAAEWDSTFKIGRYDTGLYYWFNGSIDDLMIFNRSLTSEEVLSLYNATRLSHSSINLTEGNHTFTAYTEDTNANVFSSNVSFSIDTAFPAINIISPVNGINYNNQTLNVTINSSETGNGSIIPSIDNGLVSWYRMDDINSTGGVVDYMGRNNGTNRSITQVDNGKFGKGVSFNGVNSSINTSGFYYAPDTGNFTISAWIYWDGSSVYFQNIVGSNGPSFAGAASYFRIWGYPSYYGKIGIGRPGADPDLYSNAIATNTWNHVLVTRSGTNLSIYINGLINATKTSSQSYNFSYISGPIYGTSGWDGANGWFSGKMDDLQLYNRSLSSSEILALYNATKPSYNNNFGSDGNHSVKAYVEDTAGNINSSSVIFTVDNTNPTMNLTSPVNGSYYNTTNPAFNVSSSENGTGSIITNLDNSLVSWWRMDDLNSSGGVVDYMSRNNGTSTGAVQVGSGKFGKGMSFDGANSYLTINSKIDTGQNLTLSFWINPKTNAETYIGNKRYGDVSGYVVNPDNGFFYLGNGTDGQSWYMGFDVISSLNTWTMETIIVNNTSITCYLNGAYFSSIAKTINGNIGSGTQNFRIGADPQYAPSYSFNGTLDDVMVFNRSLASAEVLSLYNATRLSHSAITLADGSHNFTAYAEDLAANIFTNSSSFYTDSTMPTLNLSSPANGSTVNTTPLFNVSSSELGTGSIIPNLDNSLVSWWRMDDLNSTGGVVDYMGRNNCTTTNSPVQVDNGKFGKAFNFNTNQYLSTIAIPGLTKNLSLVAWVKTGDTSNRQGIIAKLVDFEFEILGGRLRGYAQNSSTGDESFRCNTGMTFTDNAWHLATVTYNGTTWVAYGDGIQTCTGTGITGTLTNNYALTVGLYDVNYFNGSIDDAMVFNRTLTSDEIVSLYNATRLSHYNITLADGSHNFTAYTEDLAGNIRLNSSIFNVDGVNPQFSGYWDNNGTTTTNIAYFNVTVNNTNGTVILSINGSNFSANNMTARVYNATVRGLLNGTYSYNWSSYGNGTLHNYYMSPTQSYTESVIRVSACGTISSPGYYQLNQSISSANDCMTISASNVTLDGNGYNITFDTDEKSKKNGIVISVASYNVTIKNFRGINGQLDQERGIKANSNLTSSIIYNNTIGNQSSQYGIFIQGYSNSNNISSNTFNSNSFYIIYFYNSSTNDIISKNIITYPASTTGLTIVLNADNLTLFDQFISSYNFSASSNVSFVNSTYGSVTLFNMNGTGGNLIKDSTSDIRIGNDIMHVNSSQAGLNRSANITLYGLSTSYNNPAIYYNGNIVCNSSTTPSCSNFTSLKAGNVTFNASSWSNYTIGNAPIPISTCTTISSPGSYYLTQSLTSSSDCMTISSDNVTFDGKGFGITYNTDDQAKGKVYSGIKLSGARKNITIKNFNSILCSYDNDDNTAIYSDSSLNNSIIYNNSVIFNLYGITIAGASFSNNITNNSFCSSLGCVDAVKFSSTSTNDIIIGNTFTESTGTNLLTSSSVNNLTLYDTNIYSYNFSASSNVSFVDSSYGILTLYNMNGTGTSLFGNTHSPGIKIANNSVFVDSTKAGLNRTANITLYNILTNFTNPKIYYNSNITCNTSTTPSCYNFTSLVAGNVIFNVSSWSNYSIGSGPTLVYPQFSGYLDNNASIFSRGIAFFNVTVTSTNGSVWLTINGTNYTAINSTSSLYQTNVSGLYNGTYDYYWGAYGNGTDILVNISETLSYTVNDSFFTSEGDLTEWKMLGRWLDHNAWDNVNYTIIQGLNRANYSAGQVIDSSPAVANGYVYFGDNFGVLHQVNASNVSQQIAITTPHAGCGLTSPAVVNYYLDPLGPPDNVDSYLYIGDTCGDIYLYNASDISTYLYTYFACPYGPADPNCDNYAVYSPAVANGYVYFGTGSAMSGMFYQLNASDLSYKASFTNTCLFPSTPAIASGYVYIGDCNSFYQFDASDITQPVATYMTSASVSSSPAVSNGLVYFGTDGGYVYQLNASDVNTSDGGLVTSYSNGALGAFKSSPAVYNGYVYIGDTDGNLLQFSTSDLNSYSYIYNTGSNPIYSSPAISNGYVYVGDDSGTLYQFDANDITTPITTYATGGAIKSYPAVANGYVYVTSENMYLYQLNYSNISMNNNFPPPPVTIVYPVNAASYGINVSAINYSLYGSGFSRCWYSNSSGSWNSTTNASGTNFTYVISKEGTNNWTVYCNYTNTTIVSSSIGFAKDTIFPTINISSPLNLTAYTNQTLNVTINSSETGNGTIIPNIDGSLVSWWRMDDTNSTGGVVDYMGRNNGTNYSVKQNDSGKFGKSMSFDGGSSYINAGNSTSLNNISSQITVAAWAKWTGGSYYRTIVSKGHDSGESYSMYIGDVNNDIVFEIYNTGLHATSRGIYPSSQDTWYNIVGTYNGSAVKLYVNGNLIDTVYTTGNIQTTSSNVSIGYLYPGFPAYFNGALDNVMIFNRSLNSQEILELYNATKPSYNHNFGFDGVHNFSAYVEDSAGNINSTIISFNITTPPIINMVYPINITYNINVSTINYTLSNNGTYCWYSNSSGTWNSTPALGAGNNFTYVVTKEGGNIFTLYCNNSAGLSSSNVTFYKDTVIPTLNIISPSNGSTYANQTINVTINSSETNNGTMIPNIDNSLVSWWRMDDLNSTGGIVDYMGRNNGTNYSITQNDSGKFGKGMSFNGVSSYIDFGNNQNFNFGNFTNFSVSFWIKGANQDAELIGKGTDAQNSPGWNIQAENSGGVYGLGVILSMGDGAHNINLSQASTWVALDNQWHFVTITVNRTGLAKVYYEGALVNSTSVSSIGNISNSNNFRIGKRGDNWGLYTGSIDNVMIFNRSLSSTEVLALYNATVPSYLYNFGSDGNHSIQAIVEDYAGNVNSTTSNFTIETGTNLTICRNLTTANTVYTLQNNVTATGSCFNITADNIILNGNGYAIRFNNGSHDNSSGISISGVRTNITIKNFMLINDSESGNANDVMAIIADSNISNSTIYNNTIKNYGKDSVTLSSGIYVTGISSFNNITNNNITASGDSDGIYFTTNSSFDTVYGNYINTANYDAIILGAFSINDTVSYNNFSVNRYGMLVFSNSTNNTFSYNNVTSTTSYGVWHFSSSPSTSDRISNNIIISSLSSLYYSSFSTNNMISNNNLTSSNENAIYFIAPTNSDNITGNNLSSATNGYDLQVNQYAKNLSLNDQPVAKYAFVQNSNVTFSNSTYGIVTLFNLNGTGGNLIKNSTSDIRIGNNSVYVNSTQTGLNKTANITLYGISTSYSTPVIYYNGNTVCNSSTTPSCSNFTSLKAGTVSFNASSWSNYSIGESTFISSCITINSPGVYTLTRNISSDGDCMVIFSDNVVLDGNGYKISYDADSDGYNNGINISGARTNVTIKNLILSCPNSKSGEYAIRTNSSLANSIIYNNTLLGNVLSGIFLSGSSNGNNISNNSLISIVVGVGISLGSTSTNDVISSNGIGDISGGNSLNIASNANGLTLLDQNIHDYSFGATSNVNFINSTYGTISLFNILASGTELTGFSISDIRIGNNSAYVNSGNSGLNKSANITLYNIGNRGYSYPAILRDGVLCNSTTSPSCYNYTSLIATNVIFNVSSWSNYSIGSGNSAPNTPVVSINSSDGSNKTLADLKCYSTISDPDNDAMNVTVAWFRNNVTNLTINYNNNYPNGTLFNATLNNLNTTRDENWSCGLLLFDGTANSSWANSSNLLILNSLPTITIVSPTANNLTTNRSQGFSWTATDDDPLDTLTYFMNISCYYSTGGRCSVDDRNVTAISTTYYNPTSYYKYLADNGYYYNWSALVSDGTANSSWTTQRNLSVQSSIVLSLPVATVNFGNMNNSDKLNTTTDSPAPFILKNEGNAETNISANFTDLWQTVANPSKYYQFKVRNLTSGCFVYGNTTTDWTNATASTVTGYIIQRLNFTNGYQTGCNNASIDVSVEVPSAEYTGNRSSTVTLTGSLGEPYSGTN